MMKIKNYVIGAGGHCRAILRHLLLKLPKNSIRIIDLAGKKYEDSIMGVFVIEKNCLELIKEKSEINFYCAIGDNKKRIEVWNE